ncbi:MAG: hypothetical protein M0T74_08565 [Desulfitobacterium hafniense]|nr:hypothetical protein [Desulfitobacterium hafniense]
MIREANALNFPLIEIPYDLSVSDIILSLIKEIVNARRNESEKLRSNAFLLSLFRGEEQGEDSILAAGLPFGLLPNSDYTVLNVSFNSLQEDVNPDLKIAVVGFSWFNSWQLG